MIFIACGAVMIAVGLLWLISPAKRPNRVYGYLSYLASVNKASFRYAQKIASWSTLATGAIAMLAGLLIHLVHGDRFFILWLLTLPLFIIAPIIYTEKKLQAFLKKRHELPSDYIEPDQVKHEKTKGFKDL